MKTYTVVVKDQDDDLMHVFIVQAPGAVTLMRKVHRCFGKWLLDTEIALDKDARDMILDSVSFDWQEGVPMQLGEVK